MAKLTATFGKRNRIGIRLFLAVLFLMQLANFSNAHDLGISSINLHFSGENLTVYSSYAKADFNKLSSELTENNFKRLVKHAFEIKIDGEILNAREADTFSLIPDNIDGLVIEHSFKKFVGTKVHINSLLPVALSPDHTQILTITRDDGREISRQILKENFQFEFDLNDLKQPSGFGQFLPLGIEHILFGFDHLLFLLALLLTIKKTREMVGIITFFTLAHSITLSLVSLDILQVPSIFVEPVIAVSIIYVGVENLFKTEHKNRWLVTYLFGLVHGLGFASALQEIGIGQGTEVFVPLLSFNLGVEIGQITVALLILPIIWKLQKTEFYETKLIPTVSVLIASAGVYWLIERIFY